jgi:hypothetical protein
LPRVEDITGSLKLLRGNRPIQRDSEASVRDTAMARRLLFTKSERTDVMQVTTPSLTRYATAKNKRDLRSFFEHSSLGVDVIEDGLAEINFGEFLVEQGVLDRFQLFRALQMQDRLPGVRLGEAAAALGYAPIGAIERLFQRFQGLQTVTVG